MITMILVSVLSLAHRTLRRERQGHDRNHQLGGARRVVLCVPSVWLRLAPTVQKREESTKSRRFRQETPGRLR